MPSPDVGSRERIIRRLMAVSGAGIVLLGVGMIPLIRAELQTIAAGTAAPVAVAVAQIGQVIALLVGGLLAISVLAIFALLRHTDELAQRLDQLSMRAVNDQKAEQRRAELRSMLVHDMRTPVANIQMALDLLRHRDATPLSTEQSEIVSQARQGGRRLQGLLEDLLAVSKLEEGELRLDLQPCDLRVMLPALVHELRPIAEQEGHTVTVTIDPATPHANLDARLIERVLINLLGNAFQHTPRGSQITISAYSRDNYLKLLISDTGSGLSLEQQQRMFQRWQSSAKGRGGYGLGLTFCKIAIEAHSGTIDVQSEVGRGTTFMITVPMSTMMTDETSKHHSG